MKLIFDQNLSPRLAVRLQDLFPGSAHVQDFALDRSDDDAVWVYARANGFFVVTKDDDYNNMSVARGHPPKILWLQLRNCTTTEVETVLRARFTEIEAFAQDPALGTLVLT